MANKKVARATTGFTPDEQEVLDRANAAARAQLHAQGGKSTIDELWDEMDAVLGRLLGEYADAPASGPDYDEWRELRGQAQGLAFALALMTQPYGDRSIDDVRVEAMRRQERGEEARRPRRRP